MSKLPVQQQKPSQSIEGQRVYSERLSDIFPDENMFFTKLVSFASKMDSLIDDKIDIVKGGLKRCTLRFLKYRVVEKGVSKAKARSSARAKMMSIIELNTHLKQYFLNHVFSMSFLTLRGPSSSRLPTSSFYSDRIRPEEC